VVSLEMFKQEPVVVVRKMGKELEELIQVAVVVKPQAVQVVLQEVQE
jgi:hypothetical protein